MLTRHAAVMPQRAQRRSTPLLRDKQVVLPLLDRVQEGQFFGELHLAGSAHCDRLELSGAHERPGAALARAVIAVALDHGAVQPRFTSLADTGNADLVGLPAQFPLDAAFGLARAFAPKCLRVADFDAAVIDEQIDRLVRLTRDDDSLVAGVLEIGGPESVRMAGAGGIR